MYVLCVTYSTLLKLLKRFSQNVVFGQTRTSLDSTSSPSLIENRVKSKRRLSYQKNGSFGLKEKRLRIEAIEYWFTTVNNYRSNSLYKILYENDCEANDPPKSTFDSRSARSVFASALE